MNNISNLADEMATEILSEAADTFFGQRKSLEEHLVLFNSRVQQLEGVGKRARQMQGVLHGILLNETVTRDFYRTLDITEPESVESLPAELVARHVFRQRAWTLRGRFTKLLLTVYAQTQSVVDEYLYGSYRNDPEHPKRKIAVTGYKKLVEWADELNRNINKLNTEQSPNEVLHFVKGLDRQTCAMEKAAGAPCDMGRDRGMLFSCIDFASLDLPNLPEYPQLTKVEAQLRRFCGNTCDSCGPEVRALFKELGRYWQA
ncbi:hypothetical protein SAMN05660653_03183 [Desulfonatronum thiosulfatophilum]|uniref:Uncharacterized protein n=1 Tax=Desulfonatronum thiosulfatophilum TaxID=617002 RepID=A0A1G6EV08_9BACT|nr:hypothetical protein [Desulfonatronum thiosulfatophilum]SDB61256.1 hypothetical protein SAMN05660653_03183 [Desulfonatronum thiosulfatophilum]